MNYLRRKTEGIQEFRRFLFVRKAGFTEGEGSF